MGTGKIKHCIKCGNSFLSSQKHKLICEYCSNIIHQEKTCPVCGKKFNIKWQNNTCCSQSCAKKLAGNFKNAQILEKIKQTNIKRYDVENPFNNKSIQEKANRNNDRKKQSEKLKELNVLKYSESRRLRNLSSKTKQISHKEMVLLDRLNNSYNVVSQHTFDDCVFRKKLRFDLFIPSQDVKTSSGTIHHNDLIIEYDGEQHYEPIRFNNISDTQMYKNFISTQIKDWIKDKYCIENGIPLVRIPPIKLSNPSFDDIYKNGKLVGKPQCSDKILSCFGIISEDFVNTSWCTFTIMSGISCTFKCNKESKCDVCQNKDLNNTAIKDYNIDDIISIYKKQYLPNSITFQGLEPLDNLKQLLWFIYYFRLSSNDRIYIWTGYTEDECSDLIYLIEHVMKWCNIIIKYGRFIPNQKPHYDNILGVNLISDNQYAKAYNIIDKNYIE